MLQSPKYPWHITAPLGLSLETLKPQHRLCPHSSPHAVSPLPKPAWLKIVLLRYRYFPDTEDFDQSNSSTRSPSLDDFRDEHTFPFRAISHLFVDIESKYLSYRNVKGVMKGKGWSKYSCVLPARGKGEHAVESSSSKCRRAPREDYVPEN